MSIKPSLAFQRIGSPNAVHELSVYVDYQCGKCRILAKALDEHVIPQIQPGGKLDGKLSIILRLAPQNWHISSASLAEVALAVGKLSPSSFWKASLALFEQQPQFLNVLAQELTSRQIRKKAAEVVIQAVPELKGRDLTALTANVFAEGGLGQNGPSSVTADLQYNVKIARQISVQHTPTLTFDGIIQGHVFDGATVNGIFSSWGAAEWDNWLRKNVE